MGALARGTYVHTCTDEDTGFNPPSPGIPLRKLFALIIDTPYACARVSAYHHSACIDHGIVRYLLVRVLFRGRLCTCVTTTCVQQCQISASAPYVDGDTAIQRRHSLVAQV